VADIIFIAGIIIVALALIQGLVFVMTGLARSGRENERNSLSLRLLDEQIDSVCAKRSKEEGEVAGWSGWRKFQVIKRKMEPGNVCSFYLSPHDKKPICGFDPGQYLTFSLDIPNESKPVVRCYSLSDGPRDDYYRVSIKRVPAPRDKPDVPPGKGSNFFHDHIQEGEIIDVKAPGGHFFLDLSTDYPLVLIGGGSAIGLLGLSAVVCIILGMGLPTLGVYVLLAALVAPALIQVGIEPVAAHLYVLYFGMMSMITPPIAMAAFAAASIARAPAMATGWAAMKFGWAAYVIPVLFVFSPTLIMIGEPVDITIAVITAAMGVWLVSAALAGYFSNRLSTGMQIGRASCRERV